MSAKGEPGEQREILNVEEAAAFLGVSIKTFNKVLHTQKLPARKIGREWKFSRRALVDWVASGSSTDFYRESAEGGNGSLAHKKPQRTAGWQIEVD